MYYIFIILYRYEKNPLVKPAQDIIQRIWSRDLYSCVGVTIYDSDR